MVEKLLCETCNKFCVCSIFNKIKPFTNLSNKDLGVDFVMDSCEQYDENEQK